MTLTRASLLGNSSQPLFRELFRVVRVIRSLREDPNDGCEGDSGVLQKISECSVCEQCVPFVTSSIRGSLSREALPLKNGDKDEK